MAYGDPITWDSEVELFRAGPGIVVTREKMTMRDAVDAFMALPEKEQRVAGIGLHEMKRMTINGREAVVGFLNADAVRALADLLLAGNGPAIVETPRLSRTN